MLRCARRYDANTDSIVFANNLPYTRDSYNMAGVGYTAEPLFRFGKQMSNMKVDNAEYALLTAVVIFSGISSFPSSSIGRKNPINNSPLVSHFLPLIIQQIVLE